MLVHSNPRSAADEDAYNRWYDTDHLPALRALEGVASAVRYRLSPDGAEGPHRYLAIYELDGPVPDVLARIRALGNTSDTLDAAGVRITVWSPVSDGGAPAG
jgi:hypothetical protein